MFQEWQVPWAQFVGYGKVFGYVCPLWRKNEDGVLYAEAPGLGNNWSEGAFRRVEDEALVELQEE